MPNLFFGTTLNTAASSARSERFANLVPILVWNTDIERPSLADFRLIPLEPAEAVQIRGIKL